MRNDFSTWWYYDDAELENLEHADLGFNPLNFTQGLLLDAAKRQHFVSLSFIGVGA
jgi:hypothetical protein